MNPAEPSPETEDEPLVQNCATCGAAIDISDEEPLAEITCPACGAPETVSGQVDQFELQQVVGRGGMGVVFKAYDRGLDRYVALKLLRRDKSNKIVVEQLQKEAQITASINHPHVVRVFTSGTDHGRFFIAMELVDKGTLDDLIHLQGKVAESQVLEVGSQIAQGLRAAFQAGLIHRDVKPGNILFADSHTAKIVDFGLAIFQAEEEAQRGEVWGTPYYVAPEKLDNKPEDFRSDIYSLGGTLFHALAGRPPFEGEDASRVALKHLKSQAVSLQAFAPNISTETAYVINRTLSKDPNDRYQSYDELIEHLDYAREKLQTNGGVPQQKKRVVLEDDEQQRAMGWITATMFGLILLLAIGVFAFRKKIFRGDEDASATPVDVANAKSGPFPEARAKLAAGDPAGAVEIYRQQLANPKLPPLQQAWANFGEGLAQLIAGQPVPARTAFETIVERAQFKSKGEEEKIDFFLRDLAREMATAAPVRAAGARSLNLTNHEAFAIFAYGVKDWALGQTEDAGTLLRLFRQQANPAGSNAWMNDLKPLATNLLEDQAAYEMAADRLKAAKRPDQRAKAVADLRKVKGPFKQMAAELEKKIPAPKPVALPKLGEWAQSEFGTPDVLPTVTRDEAGVFTIKAGGSDLWNNSDNGHFVYRIIEGDFEFVARLESMSKPDPSAKAGLMVRDSLKVDARNVALVAIASGDVAQQIRAKASTPTTSVKKPGAPPQWFKLVRKGSAITGFRSADGQTWTEVATQKLDGLPASTYVGLAVAAHSSTTAAVAKFDSVSVAQ
jgi:eukaryotic-like serine/threonine-protein kinase